MTSPDRAPPLDLVGLTDLDPVSVGVGDHRNVDAGPRRRSLDRDGVTSGCGSGQDFVHIGDEEREIAKPRGSVHSTRGVVLLRLYRQVNELENTVAAAHAMHGAAKAEGHRLAEEVIEAEHISIEHQHLRRVTHHDAEIDARLCHTGPKRFDASRARTVGYVCGSEALSRISHGARSSAMVTIAEQRGLTVGVQQPRNASTVSQNAWGKRPSMSHLVVDVGTSNMRCLVLRPNGTVTAEHRRAFAPTNPFQGAVEFDAAAMATAVIELASQSLAEAGPVTSVGITCQRASAIVWNRTTGIPVGPGIGWQDLRTAGVCVMAGAMGVAIAPNQTATKAQYLFDAYDSDRSADLCLGTVDSWIIWTLTKGSVHVIESSNAAVTGLIDIDEASNVVWDDARVSFFRLPPSALPRIVPSVGLVGLATALPGSPPITGVSGDQQSSMIGQGCVLPGLSKITFGTGAMFDLCLGPRRPAVLARSLAGTFPIVTWAEADHTMYGLEAIALTAGACVAWLVEDMGVLASPAQSAEVAAQCETTDGVAFVPALLGLGTPVWDYGARGTLLGLTRGTGRPQIVRAVLEGIAQRGADLVDAAEADAKMTISALRIDGGMSANPVFVQALADATNRRVEVSPMLEATALGAGYLAGMATGTWSSWEDIAALWKPTYTVEPSSRANGFRDGWLDAVQRSRGWDPDLSALNF